MKNSSEHVYGLIYDDNERFEKRLFERLRAELALAFSAPDSSYSELNAQDIFNRNS